MHVSDDDLSQAYRQATSRVASNAERCLAPDTIWQLAARELAPPERAAALEHVAACADCADELRLVLAPAVAAPAAPAWRRLAATVAEWLSVAPARAALAIPLALVMLALALPLLRPGVEPAPVWRGAGEDDVVASPGDGEERAGAPDVLSWSGARPGAPYRVAIYDGESSLIWESAPLDAPRVTIPADVRARLHPGATYAWRVTSGRGIDRRVSRLLTFRIQP